MYGKGDEEHKTNEPRTGEKLDRDALTYTNNGEYSEPIYKSSNKKDSKRIMP